MDAVTKDAQQLAHVVIDDDEAIRIVQEAQQLCDAMSPTIGADLRGYVKDIDAAAQDDDLSQRTRVSLAACVATLAVCAERIAQDTLLTQLSAATLN